MSERKLNLGCGAFAKPGFVNVDADARSGADVIHDLDLFPYPFADGEFAHIEADHVLEHLQHPFAVMRELHRILRDHGTLVIRVPHFSRGFTHADHKRGFDVTFPLYFDPAFQGGYSGTPFQHQKTRLRWFAQPYLKQTLMPKTLVVLGQGLGAAIDGLAALSPFVCSRLWCYWVGGFEEIEFQFSRPAR